MVAGTLVACPAGYAQNQKPASRALRQLPSPNTTDQSDLKPTVLIKMQIQGIPGGQDIDVFGYEQETTMTGSFGGGGGGAGKLVPGPVTVSKRIDDVSPFLNRIHVEGSHIKEVTLQWIRLDPSGKSGQVFFTVKLNDAFISAIHRSLPNQQDPLWRASGKSKRFPSPIMTSTCPQTECCTPSLDRIKGGAAVQSPTRRSTRDQADGWTLNVKIRSTGKR